MSDSEQHRERARITLASWQRRDEVPEEQVDRTAAEFAAVAAEAYERGRAEAASDAVKFREALWLLHGHDGLYGDDGEMQCCLCLPFTDYKRGDAGDLVEAATKAIRASLAEAYERGRAEQREADAKLCDEEAARWLEGGDGDGAAMALAAAIRAGSK